MHSAPRAAYVHIPFCISKCHYCDFSSFAGMDELYDDYVEAVALEISRVALGRDGDGLDSVYFGGGTPTILAPRHLARLLSALESSLGLADGCEITVEANPGTVDEAKLVELLGADFNRLSLGVQSFDDDFLARIGRAHTAGQAIDAYRVARSAGFENVGIDLIFSLPGQTLGHWSTTLDQALELGPEHISLYELTIEEGTRFASMCARGELSVPDEESQIEMYEFAIERLARAGYEHYEVSNFAIPGYRSMHNQVYWRNEPYYGFGAGATSYLDGNRSRRMANPKYYIDAIRSGHDAVEFSEHLSGKAALGETTIQGLRMLDGISMYKITAQTGTDVISEFEQQIAKLSSQGLVEVSGDVLRVTHRGLLLMNDVASEFLPG